MPMYIFNCKGASGFSWASTADQVTQDLTAIITGASSGIGAETTRVLAERSAHVIMNSRNLAATDSMRKAVFADTPSATLDVMDLDLSSMPSVRKFTVDFNAKEIKLSGGKFQSCPREIRKRARGREKGDQDQEMRLGEVACAHSIVQ